MPNWKWLLEYLKALGLSLSFASRTSYTTSVEKKKKAKKKAMNWSDARMESVSPSVPRTN